MPSLFIFIELVGRASRWRWMPQKTEERISKAFKNIARPQRELVTRVIGNLEFFFNCLSVIWVLQFCVQLVSSKQ
jgi:hypothetical protein